MKTVQETGGCRTAAALALAMVGCGGRNSLTHLDQDVIADFYAMEDKDVTNKRARQWPAAQAHGRGRRLCKAEISKTVLELLIDEEVGKAAGIKISCKGNLPAGAVENYKPPQQHSK